MASKLEKTMRTYVLPTKREKNDLHTVYQANQAKLHQVAAVLPVYQELCGSIQAYQWQRFLSGMGTWNMASTKHIPTNLIERYKRPAQNQVVAGLDSWIAKSQDVFRGIVTKSSLPQEVKHDLYRINKAKAWYKKEWWLLTIVTYPDGGTAEYFMPVEQSTLKLARQIMKNIKNQRNHLPNLAKSRTMMLDNLVAQFEPSRTKSAAYWVRMSTLTKGKPVWIPLQTHRFAETGAGSWAKLTQVTVDLDGTVTFKQVKKSIPAKVQNIPKDGCKTLGLDSGMINLFGTSEGDLLGNYFYQWLKQRDEEVLQLAKKLQAQNIPLKNSKRYKKLQKRISEFIENEINRILNALVLRYDPAEIVVERLDFRGRGKVSKDTRRMMTRVGLAAVKAKLQALHETLGITITYVPAAYTSQECSGCGFIDELNRKTQNRFVCGFCGKKAHADINASKTVRSRRSWTSLDEMQFVSRSKLLVYLDSIFQKRWGISPNAVRDRIRSTRKASKRSNTDELVCSMDSEASGSYSNELVPVR